MVKEVEETVCVKEELDSKISPHPSPGTPERAVLERDQNEPDEWQQFLPGSVKIEKTPSYETESDSDLEEPERLVTVKAESTIEPRPMIEPKAEAVEPEAEPVTLWTHRLRQRPSKDPPQKPLPWRMVKEEVETVHVKEASPDTPERAVLERDQNEPDEWQQFLPGSVKIEMTPSYETESDSDLEEPERLVTVKAESTIEPRPMIEPKAEAVEPEAEPVAEPDKATEPTLWTHRLRQRPSKDPPPKPLVEPNAEPNAEVKVPGKWGSVLTNEYIIENYTLVNGQRVLIAPQKLRDDLRKTRPLRRVQYCQHDGNCQYASILAAGQFRLRYNSISELKRAALDFFLENEAELAKMFKDLFPDICIETWSKLMKTLFTKRVGSGTLQTLHIIALICKRNIMHYDIQSETWKMTLGTHPILQPEAVSGPDLYIVRRIGEYFVYTEGFSPDWYSQNHASQIILVEPGQETTYELTEKLKLLTEKDPGQVINYIEYLLFEYILANGISVTLSSSEEVCTCILFPKDILREFIHPLGNVIKNEGKYQDQLQNARFQVSDSEFIKCTTRGAHHNDITMEFRLHEQSMAVWMFKVITRGKLFGH